MKTRRGSLTVEAALIFPMTAVLIVSFLQIGLYLSLSLWTKTLCEQSMMRYRSLREAGADAEEAAGAVERELEKTLGESLLRKTKAGVTVQPSYLEDEIRISAEGEYSFLFAQQVSSKARGWYRRPRRVRDTLCVVEETGEKIPFVADLWDRYEKVILELAKEMSQ